MKETLKRTKLPVRVYSQHLRVISSKASGRTINTMAKVRKNGKTAHLIRVPLQTAERKAKENSPGQMDRNSLGTS